MDSKARRFSAALTALLLALLAGCSGSGEPELGSPGVPASLQEALQMIQAEEAAALAGKSHGASALPETQAGDDVWLAGPAGTTTIDSVDHKLTISSNTSQISNAGYLSFGIFKFQGNTGLSARHLFLNTFSDPSAQYTIYVVRYFSSGIWTSLGTFDGDPGGNGLPCDLPTNCISPAGNIYVAVVVADQKSLTINSTRVSDLFETEDNDSAGQANRIPYHNGDVSTSLDGQIGSGAPGGDTDGDSSDWFYFSAPSAGTLYLGFDYTNSTGRVDSYLYAGDTVTELDSGDLADGDEYIVERIFGPGSVFIKLDCTAGFASYTIDLRFDNGTFADQEDNDTFGTANSLGSVQFSAQTSGEIGPTGSNDGDSDDWYSFSGSPGLARIKMFVSNKGGNLGMDLVAADGSTVVSSAQLEQNYYVIEEKLSAGTFYLHIKTGGDTDYYCLQGYAGTLLTQADATEIEPNDFALSANALPSFPFITEDWIGSVGFGPNMRNYDGDRHDWSKFDIPSAGTVDINCYLNADDGDIDLYMYDSGQSLISSDTNFGNLASLSVLLPSAGTYYLEVRGAYGGADYTLDGNFTP